MTKLEIYDDRCRFIKNNRLNSVLHIPQFQTITNHLEWHKNNKLHRLNRPARIYYDGVKDWYENGEHIKTEYPKK